MFHLPNEDSLRTISTYSQTFMLTLLWNVGILGIIFSSLFVISFALKQYLIKMNEEKYFRDSILTFDERTSNNHLTERSKSNHQIKSTKMIRPQNRWFKIINFITSIAFYLTLIIISFIGFVFFMFGMYGTGTHIDILTAFVTIFIVVFPTLIWKYKTKVSDLIQIRRQIIITIILLFLWIALCIAIVIVLKGACVCHSNNYYGFLVDGNDLYASTQFTRNRQIKKVCEDGRICHIYATLPEDTAHEVFINIHTGINLKSLVVSILLENTLVESKNSSSLLAFDNIQQNGQRQIHTVVFKKLIPNTQYVIEIINPESKLILQKVNYKTLPDSSTNKIKMAVGGDIGMTPDAKTLTNYLINENPDVIIIGGDTAYDNAMRTCYYSWDNFYNIFEDLNKKLNRIVPIILTVGNHDVGFDAFATVEIDRNEQNMPLFFVYHPQHSPNDTKQQIPPISDRLSYHYHLIGPSIHFNLDSNYLISHADQVNWMKNLAEKNPKIYKFANYHNPIYPSCTDPTDVSNDKESIRKGKAYWGKIFDNYHFTASFQHHTHFRKITHKIFNDSISDYGTRYLGDGSWGVAELTCKQHKISPQINLIKNFGNSKPNHIWIVNIERQSEGSPYVINYTAINLQGRIQWTQIDQLPFL